MPASKSRLGRLLPVSDLHLSALIRGASIVGFLKALSAFFNFALGVVLGRALGADAAGVYFLAVTTATIAATIGRVGLDSAVLRDVATNVSHEQWSQVRRIHRSAVLISLTCSTVVALAMYLSADVLAGYVFADHALAGRLRIVALAVVPAGLCAAEGAGEFVVRPASAQAITIIATVAHSTSVIHFIRFSPQVGVW